MRLSENSYPAPMPPPSVRPLEGDEKERIFKAYCDPVNVSMADICKEFAIDEPTAHMVYDELEAMVRALRRRPPGGRPFLGGS